MMELHLVEVDLVEGPRGTHRTPCRPEFQRVPGKAMKKA